MSALGSLAIVPPRCRYCDEDATGGFCFSGILRADGEGLLHICPKCVQWAFGEVLTRVPRPHKGDDK
jgi:hypothetical protein